MPVVPETMMHTFLDTVDWTRTELAPLRRENDPRGTALALVHHLRTRETPRLGYTVATVNRLRAASPSVDREAATQQWEAALAQDLFQPWHSNAFAALGLETIILGATPDVCRRMAARIIACQPQWPVDGTMGTTQSICELLRYLWPLPECTDEQLVAVLVWLTDQLAREWQWAKTWGSNVLGNSGHNWWAHTFFGFWQAGLFFPELKDLGQFQAFVPDYLERELNLLFAEDGWSKEGAPGYHLWTIADLVTFAWLAELNGITLPERIHQRVRRIVNSGWRLLAPDGTYPAFGDNTYPVQWERPNLRAWAARFSLPEAKYVIEALNPTWTLPAHGMLLDDGEDLLPAYRRLSAQHPGQPDTCLSHSGFYVMRSDWTPSADYAAVLAGPVGDIVTSHKHVDLFNIHLYSRGSRILVDNGYGSETEEEKNDKRSRLWRESSAAHNVFTVDGEDHVPILGEFRYERSITPLVDDWRSDTQYAYFSAVHEGYRRLAHPINGLRRKLFYLRGHYWILIDQAIAGDDTEHRYEQHFHLLPPAELGTDGRVVTLGPEGNLLIAPVLGATGIASIEPCPYPVKGYDNPRHLRYARQTTGSDTFVTLLVPFAGDQPPTVAVHLADVVCDNRILTPNEATGLVIRIDDREDVYVDLHLHWNLPWRCHGHTGTARVFHSASMRV